ncbi:MAG: FAD-binding oxidoreductase [Pseudorhodobacter sp.]|nr:FAD-binding oxidoreductase [Pseudorhodobacter sp.]
MSPADTPLPRAASVVIVGGGIQGLCIAWYLTELGVRDVLILDAGYWEGGASGRNGTLIRPGFGGPEWTRLFELSVREWRGLSARIGHNVMYTMRGYALLAERQKTVGVIESAAEVHRREGVESRMLTRREREQLLPALDQDQVKSALFFPKGGMAPHHAAMKGLQVACAGRGVDIRYRTPVTGFERTGERISHVLVGDTRIATQSTVIAAGAQCPDLAALAGVPLAGNAMRLEAMALEPLRPLIGPAVAALDSLAYFHQTARGEIVGGTEVPGEKVKRSLQADMPVLANTARVYMRLFPQLADVRILRHWAGMIHATPDFGPMLGPHPDLRDLWISAGWSYGFAGAPGAGLLLSQAIANGMTDDRMKPFAVDRFDKEKPVHESLIVLAS